MNNTSQQDIEYLDTTSFVAGVRPTDGKVILFDPAEVVQSQVLGETRGHEVVVRLFYKNGYAEDLIDRFGNWH